ncbi:hypothetical protein C8Q75DRAFT_807235 [Abortiporus biennis]|nr:hypothetical protein C8Q75DRAFT_807235 [Abortiporus biennis]
MENNDTNHNNNNDTPRERQNSDNAEFVEFVEPVDNNNPLLQLSLAQAAMVSSGSEAPQPNSAHSHPQSSPSTADIPSSSTSTPFPSSSSLSVTSQVPSSYSSFSDLQEVYRQVMDTRRTDRDDDMPSLQTESISSADDEREDVDMVDVSISDQQRSSQHPPFQPTPSRPLPQSVSAISASSQPPYRSNSRRARVDNDTDEEEEARDRNRQRLHSPVTDDEDDDLPPPLMPEADLRTRYTLAPPTPANANPQPNQNPIHHRLFGGDTGLGRVVFDIVIGPATDGAAGPAPPPITPEQLGLPPGTVMMDLPFGQLFGEGGLGAGRPNTNPINQPANANNPPPAEGAPGTGPGLRPQQVPAAFVEALLGMAFGGGTGGGLPPNLAAMFGGEEEDDPERAKKLIAGLEEVNEGLVKRLENVGIGSGKDDKEGEGQVNCAICWEGLLEEPEPETTKDAEMSTSTSEPSPSTVPESTAGHDHDHETKLRKVVTLPCSHVFHADCLLPWFSRPHRTTCPTCRFDIDPESLTYVPRRRVPRPPPVFHPPATEVPQATQPEQPGPIPPTVQAVPLPQTDTAGPQNPQNPNEPPFYLAFDISMVVPIIPGRNGTPAATGNGTAPATGTAVPPPPINAQLPPFLFGAPTTPAQAGGPEARGGVRLPTGFVFGGVPLTNIPFPGGGVGIGLGGARPVPPTAASPSSGPTDGRPAEQGPGPHNLFGTIMNTLTQAANRAGIHIGQPHGQQTGAAAGQGQQPPVPPVQPTQPQAQANQPTQPQQPLHPGQAAAPQSPPSLAAALQSFFAGGGAGLGGHNQPHPEDEPEVPNQPHFHFHHQPPPAGNGAGAGPIPGGNLFGFNLGGGNPAGGVGGVGVGGMPMPPIFDFPFPPPHPGGQRGRANTQPRGPKPQWSLPPPPGLTLRQRVEKRERELGLRCSDISCGLAPTDEDPDPGFDASAVRKIGIHPLGWKNSPQTQDEVNKTGGDKDTFVCEHRFHPACIVSAERVAGWGTSEDSKEEKEKDGDEEVEVSCPVCRAIGCISKEDWDEGACALA